MTDGGLDAFFGGLENLVGPPNPNLEKQLEREHTAMADSTMLFRTTNYGIDTRSDLEFYCALTAASALPIPHLPLPREQSPILLTYTCGARQLLPTLRRVVSSPLARVLLMVTNLSAIAAGGRSAAAAQASVNRYKMAPRSSLRQSGAASTPIWSTTIAQSCATLRCGQAACVSACHFNQA